MSSKKQRRRREKIHRHEWEYVKLDEEGNETPVEAPAKQATANGKPAARASRRPAREPKPPSWNRSIKRALIFAPFLVILLSIGKNAPPLWQTIGIALLYAAVFVPMLFFVDRMTYRAFQRRYGSGSS